MAEQDPQQNDDLTIADEPAEAPGKSSLPARLKVLLFVAAVIVVECLLAYLFLPNAEKSAAMATAAMEPGSQPELVDENTASENDGKDMIDQIEVDLGEFSVTSYQPVSATTLRIDFHLYGTVGLDDERKFLALMEENLHRFREQVIVIIRSAEITDLTDAGLGLIKRRILEKTNRTLGKPMLRTVIFSEFSFIEQ